MRARGGHQNGFVASTGALFGQILDQPEGVSSANQRFFTLVGATKSGGADLRGGLGNFTFANFGFGPPSSICLRVMEWLNSG
jgi:hypothetical protein